MPGRCHMKVSSSRDPLAYSRERSSEQAREPSIRFLSSTRRFAPADDRLFARTKEPAREEGRFGGKVDDRSGKLSLRRIEIDTVKAKSGEISGITREEAAFRFTC